MNPIPLLMTTSIRYRLQSLTDRISHQNQHNYHHHDASFSILLILFIQHDFHDILFPISTFYHFYTSRFP